MALKSNDLLEAIEADRLESLTMDLVNIPSPTGDSDEISGYYAEYLSGLGLRPSLEKVAPGMPNVLALLKGDKSGRRITLLGHLDTIPAMGHPSPYIKDGVIYGRGSADMKSGVAAQAEVARVLIENEVKFNGEVLIATHSAHEIPGGACEGLFAMIENGVLGDAVISTEGPSDLLPVIGKGMCQYEIQITRSGDPMHENATLGEPNPIMIAGQFLDGIKQRNVDWSKKKYDYIGSQTLFVGMIQGGDFYNRLTNNCRIVGSIRFGPDKDFSDIEQELDNLINEVQESTNAKIELGLHCIGLGFNLSKDEPIVKAVRKAHKQVTGRNLPYGGIMYTADGAKVIRYGGIPAVQYGAGIEYAHAQLERVAISDIVKEARIFLQTTLNFLSYLE